MEDLQGSIERHQNHRENRASSRDGTGETACLCVEEWN